MAVRLRPASERTPWYVHLFFALVLIPYTTVFPYLDFNNPNENVRLYMTMALVEHHAFVIDDYVDLYGWVNDMARVAGKDGVEHDYSLKGPGTSFAGVPFYWAFVRGEALLGHAPPTAGSPPEVFERWRRTATFLLRLFVVQLPSFAFLVWFERWLRGLTFDPVLRLSALAAVGLGTTYFAYALMFVSHTLFAITTFVSFALLTREYVERKVRRRRVSRAFLAGLFAGLATLVEYQAFPLCVVLGLFACLVFRRVRPLLAFAAGAGLNAAALCYFQWRCFNSPFVAGYRFAENSDFAEWHRQGLYGVTSVDWQVFHDLSINRTFGFFSTSPFMWLSAAGILALFSPLGVKRQSYRVPLLVAALMMLILWLTMSSALNWRGGWTVGPRLLGAAPPFFAFFAVAGLERAAKAEGWVRAVMRGLAGGLALAGVCTLGLVAMFYNSMPEDIDRPLADLVVPLVERGFVPFHLGDFVGWHSPFVYAIPVLSVLGATGLGMALGGRERWLTSGLRFVVAVAAFLVGVAPAWGETSADAKAAATEGRKEFSKHWEPLGRDRIAVARARAEKASEDHEAMEACLWQELSDLETSVGWTEEADRDRREATRRKGRWSWSQTTYHCYAPVPPGPTKVSAAP